MERSLPTDPPDEPVNRIAKFMEQLELRKLDIGTLHSEVIATIKPAVTRLSKDMAERILQVFRERHAKDPSSPIFLKPLIRALFKTGDYQSALLFGEWFLQVSQSPDKDIEAMVAEARGRLED